MSRHGEYEGRSSGIGSGKARHLRPDRRLRGVDGFRTNADLHSMPANASERSRRGFGDPGRFSQGIPDAGALTRNRNRGTCQIADAHCRQHVPRPTAVAALAVLETKAIGRRGGGHFRARAGARSNRRGSAGRARPQPAVHCGAREAFAPAARRLCVAARGRQEFG